MLKEKKNRPFKICQLSDLHLGSYPFNKDDQKTLFDIKRMFEKNQFDLIMVTGDIIWGKDIEHPDKTFFEFYNVLNSTKIPVAITYGNHDSEGNFTRSEIRKFEKYIEFPAEKNDRFIFQDRENYVLKVYDEKKGNIVHLIFVWDSGAYQKEERFGFYSVIEPEQTDWFNTIESELTDGKKPRVDIGFTHIPIPEYRQAKIISGECGEEICSPEINSGLFYRLVKYRNFKALFAGHDHDNNFASNFKGIDLIYANVSGYNTYGRIPRGYKEINLFDDKVMTKNVHFASL